MLILRSMELENFYFKLRAELYEWLEFGKFNVPVYEFSLIEGTTPLFKEIRGVRDVFLKERYQDEFLFLCSTLFEAIGRNCGNAICYLDSQDGNLPKLHQFLGNLQYPPIKGFLCGWNAFGDWTTELVTPTFLTFDDDVLLEFKKYGAFELICFIEKEKGYNKHTYATLKIEGFEAHHNENTDTPIKKCEFWKLIPSKPFCFYYAHSHIAVSGLAPDVEFKGNSIINFEGWICGSCKRYLEHELTNLFGNGWLIVETETITNYLLRTCSQSTVE